jgi:hypothetical protein
LKSLLESGRHEGISWSRVDEDFEVDPEEEEVEEEWDDNESHDSVSEMSIKVGLLSVVFNTRKLQLTIVCPFLTSRISQRSHKTAAPILMKVNSPTILHPRVQANMDPVASSQNHHVRVNSRYRC